MPAANKTVTNVYVLMSAIKATFTTKDIGGGALLYSTSDDANPPVNDDLSIPAHRNEGSQQFVQTANVDTYARHTGAAGEDWKIVVDDNV